MALTPFLTCKVENFLTKLQNLTSVSLTNQQQCPIPSTGDVDEAIKGIVETFHYPPLQRTRSPK